MNRHFKKIFPLILFLLTAGFGFSQSGQPSQSGRVETDLSGKGWRLWLDHAAIWYNDSIYLPPVDITHLPVNPPTIGWEKLQTTPGLPVSIPGTVEQHYWGAIGGAIPDTGGNYVGVSWWSRTFTVDPTLKGKRITLCFQSVNLRAEVFVNGKLVGYDVIGNTPFDVDATSAILFGKDNQLDIRITDPVGNFEWNDNILMRWGKNLIPAVHGFGGITGSVLLRATDPVSIEDIYVQNQPDPKKVNITVTLDHHSRNEQTGQLSVSIHEKDKPEMIAWSKTIPVTGLSGTKTFTVSAIVPDARLWELSEKKDSKQAALYEATVTFISTDRSISDTKSQRFGFRWFDVQDKNQDPRFYLNGKRVFLIAAMTRGMWPKNGIFPTPEMAQRDLQTMVDLGMNTMLMHRAIGQPMVMDYADSSGLFTYEEPGGYRIMPNPKDNIDGPDDQARNLRREKLRRMILRDRSIPSMIIYNLKNEETIAPNEYDIKDMQMVHQLDPSRILTYNSGSDIGLDYHKKIPNNPFKLHMLPFNQQLLYDGWWDQHHWFGYSGYVDENYRNPRYYLRGVINSPRAPMPEDSLDRLDKKEIIFFGEEGAFGAMVRLQKIKEEVDTTGDTGYREKEHLDWFNAYNTFLDETGFRKSYPDVDSLTRSLGRNLHYFQARNIENIRMGNIADAYNMNGWASESTRTDVVDIYRHPTADASIIRYYTRPLYIAVKLRNKVVPVGAAPIADLYIVNEMDLKGKHQLAVSLSDPSGNVIFTKQFKVNITGGEEFGQLLAEGIQLPVLAQPGYYKLAASLDANGVQKAAGFDEVLTVVVNQHSGISNHCLVLEKDSIITRFLKNEKGVVAGRYSPGAARSDLIIIGNTVTGQLDRPVLDDLVKRAEEGARLVVLENADLFAQEINNVLKDRPPVYNGGGIIRWNGSGRLFVGSNDMLDGLPRSQGMSWEYQCFYKVTDDGGSSGATGDGDGPGRGNSPRPGNGQVSGIRLSHWKSEWVVAVGNQGSKEILSALSRIPVGKGSLILSTLSILPNLQTQELSAVVAKRLFLNMLK